jgi:hypothetical protein
MHVGLLVGVATLVPEASAAVGWHRTLQRLAGKVLIRARVVDLDKDSVSQIHTSGKRHDGDDGLEVQAIRTSRNRLTADESTVLAPW